MVTIWDGCPADLLNPNLGGLLMWLGTTVRGMSDEERLEMFSIRSGLAAQSVDAIRPDFPRWVRQMRKRGVTEIPDSPLNGDAHAVNMASLLIRQAAGKKNDTIAHELRNLIRIRPWKR